MLRAACALRAPARHGAPAARAAARSGSLHGEVQVYAEGLRQARCLTDNGFMQSIRYILTAVMLSTAGLAQAETAMAGIGSASCDVWLDARKKPQQEREAIIEGLVLAWVQGFLSSKNATGSKGKSVLDVPPPTSIELVMDKICGDNPDWKIYIAADTFATVLIDQYRGGGRK